MIKRFLISLLAKLLLLGLIALPLFAIASNTEPLPAADVFQLHIRIHDPNTLIATWQIKPGYFLYKDRIKIDLIANNKAQLGPVHLPTGEKKIAPQSGPYEVLRQKVVLSLPILGINPGETQLKIRYQGCSDAGFCYPPTTQHLLVIINRQSELSSIEVINPEEFNESVTTVKLSALQKVNHLLIHSSWPLILMSFFGFGLLLSFTPCVLPMIPIVSGIIIGDRSRLPNNSYRAFWLSLTYVLSMSLTYTVVGIIAAIVGQNLQLLIQQPIALATISMVFILLALSMFGLYELRIPNIINDKLMQFSKPNRGAYWGAALTGIFATLLLSPCVTAPMVAVLTFITATGNVLLGGFALFSLSLGMGAPLLLIATSAARFLPKAGPWMNGVKIFFGLLLLAVAISVLQRIPSSMIATPTESHILNYQAINTTLAGAREAIIKASQVGKPIIVDFYADWCTSCKAMEKKLEKDLQARNMLSNFTLLKIDISAVNQETQSILKHFNVIAPPTFIFFDAMGKEMQESRLVGEVSSQDFLQHLQRFVVDRKN